MIQKKSVLFVAVCLFFLTGNVAAQVYNLFWDKTYGGASRDWNCSISSNSAGDLFLIGDSQSDISGDKTLPLCNAPNLNSDVWMAKVDTGGNILWQRSFGGEADERSPKLFHLNNANKEMLFACYSTSNVFCEKTEPNRDTVPLLSPDYWVCLLDSNGVIIWDKTLGGDNFDDYTQVSQLASGKFLVAGESNSPVGYDKSIPNYTISNDLWALKLDNTGSKIWDNVYGGDGAEYMASIIPDADGSFLLAGSTGSDVSGNVSQPGQGNIDFWVIKVDDAGNPLWDKRFGGSGPDRCNYAARTSDNGYILCGFTVSPQGGDVSEAPKGIQDYWVVKIDSLGNKEWDKRFGGNGGSFGTWAAPATGSGYWIGGYSNSSNMLDVSEPSYGGSDYWILKTDSSGTKLWDKRFGGATDEFMSSMAFLADSTMMVFGHSDSGSSAIKTAASKGWIDYWMVKFSYTDTITNLPDHPDMLSEIKVLPNPSSGQCTIEFQLDLASEIHVEILDPSGKLVLGHSESRNAGPQSISMNLQELDAGYYFIRVSSDARISKIEKLVIIK